jgi:hypothetical protein
MSSRTTLRCICCTSPARHVSSRCFEWEKARSRNWVTVMSARTRTSWRVEVETHRSYFPLKNFGGQTMLRILQPRH